MTIRFYAPRDPFGCFSNFSRHPVIVYGRTWKTSEHAFQAMKFFPHRQDVVDLVWAASTPTDSCRIGRDRTYPIRADWDSAPKGERAAAIPKGYIEPDDGVSRSGVEAEPLFRRTKDVFMYEIVLAKFQQHAELKKTLLSTGTQPLIENAIHDPYWGWGCSRVGENKLGRILMVVRQNLLV